MFTEYTGSQLDFDARRVAELICSGNYPGIRKLRTFMLARAILGQQPNVVEAFCSNLVAEVRLHGGPLLVMWPTDRLTRPRLGIKPGSVSLVMAPAKTDTDEAVPMFGRRPYATKGTAWYWRVTSSGLRFAGTADYGETPVASAAAA